MSSRKYSPFPNWNTLANTQNAKWLAKQNAARAAARSAVVAKARGNVIPARLPITVPARMFAPRSGELKWVDFNSFTNALNSTTGHGYLLNGVAPGTSKYQRIGNKIRPVSIDCSIMVNNLAGTALKPIKVVIIWDKQPTGTIPNYTDIYQNVDSSGTTSSTFFAGRNMNTTDRFITLASEDIVITPDPGSQNYVHVFRMIRSLSGMQQQFKGVDALTASIATGACYLFFRGECTISDTVQYQFDARLS